LHHAARHHRKHGTTTVISNDRMRWLLFVGHLRMIDVEIRPRAPKRDMPRSSLVLPRATPCAACGKPFVMDNGSKMRNETCSLACGHVMRSRRMLEARAERVDPLAGVMATLARGR
jgi:hypothetical protein